MSLELLRSIQEAEARAEQERADAQREAREMVKGTAEACLENERRAAAEHRALLQATLEEKRAQVEAELSQLSAGREKAREELMAAARQRLATAAGRIAERILNDGHR